MFAKVLMNLKNYGDLGYNLLYLGSHGQLFKYVFILLSALQGAYPPHFQFPDEETRVQEVVSFPVSQGSTCWSRD